MILELLVPDGEKGDRLAIVVSVRFRLSYSVIHTRHGEQWAARHKDVSPRREGGRRWTASLNLIQDL